jgi:class 3 adenylate cyclase
VESIARPGQVLITDATKLQLSDTFEVALVGERQLPGRDKTTVLYEVSA